MGTYTRSIAVAALVGIASLAACNRASDSSSSASAGAGAMSDHSAGSLEGATRHDTTAGMAGMSGMSGGQMGAMMGAGMMDSIEAQGRMMDTMSAERMKAMLPTHRQMVANMLSRMNGEMRQMNMTGDAAWTATVDSLRTDLVRMPELSAAELKAMMPAHQARVARLIAAHRSMVAKMK